MRKLSAIVRRSTVALVVATGMMAVTGPANAAAGLPTTASGRADSQALRVQLTLPGVDQLRSTLIAAGVPASMIPATGVGGLTIEEKISVNHGEVLRNIKGVPNKAGGFATAITGVLPVAGEVTHSVASSCLSNGCTNPDAIAAINQDLPAGLGHIKVAGAESVTKNLLDTRNHTALATARVSLASLIGDGQPLAQIGDALQQLTATVNTTVLPPVNGALKGLEDTLSATLEDVAPEVKAELDKLITLGTINPIPDLTKVDIANLTILGAKADVFTKAVGGVTGLNSISSSKVADISLLGGWAGVDAVGILADSFANGVAGAAHSNVDVQIAGLNMGGLLGVDIDGADVNALANPDKLKAAIRTAAQDNGLDVNKAEDLVHAIELAENISGVDVTFFGTTKNVDPKGKFADATAGTLALIGEPKIPVADSMFTLPGQTVPQFSEYVSTGVRLRIDLPNASSAVSVAANVLDRQFPAPRGRTGVGSPMLLALGLMGLALVVKKFAMAK